jgi:hypothetical protein
MNVRQKLSLAAMCIALPALATAQAAAPAAEAAPAFEVKPYGFLLLTLNQQSGQAGYAEYLGKVGANEDLKANHFSARQSRFGLTIKNADSGYLGAKSLSGRLEFDFMGGAAGVVSSYDSVVPRLRYAVAMAEWAAGPGKLTATLGQTDGLVNSLHPELGAYIALPTFLQAGNLTRRSPQIRLGYAFTAGIADLSIEAAALSSVDAAGVTTSAGNANGTPDLEARLQATVKPVADVKATVAVGYHMNKRLYDPTLATEQKVDSSLVGVELNVDATKYVTVKGEWFTGSAADASQGGAFADVAGAAPNITEVDTTGFWAQATIKPVPLAWIIAGYGQETAKGIGAAPDQTRSMMNVGVLSPVSKNWRLGVEYTKADYDDGATTVSASEIALSSRFSF